MSGIMCALVSGSKETVLTSVTFTANATWVAPSSVSNVLSASGKGADGTSDTLGTIFAGQYYADQLAGPFENPPYALWSDLYNSYATGLAQISSKSYPGFGPSAFLYFDLYYVDPGSNWRRYLFSPIDLSGAYITSYTPTVLGSPPTSGVMTYSSIGGPVAGRGITLTGYTAGGAGAATTALGQTFPGGTYTGTYPNGVGNAAVTTTYTNVAVTPNTSYSIVVPAGGTVTLQYYV